MAMAVTDMEVEVVMAMVDVGIVVFVGKILAVVLVAGMEQLEQRVLLVQPEQPVKQVLQVHPVVLSVRQVPQEQPVKLERPVLRVLGLQVLQVPQVPQVQLVLREAP